ncbi:MAG: SMC-Scp complex subunit ScpB [Gammaproteobacteria bacterium]|jgi:segregation and condensation protein B|nr:SMC-Scp complex subunit ScpB [Gammaproteobacteria bacterium]MDG1230906.1 SMC-Scp complex subunit ScpB [Pseudomonadales bacterium]MBT5153625.1 SMC-Scp complex subunit ScpB [Gammaproteobacteria bacterium]MBT5683415.1 SMC-Scp complex subunit ScpB [Gammaproteobacteria bacterium]MBT6583171.1 SMC-Scp complex subunit ScpB [Gammaproteobacteria bacterium]
MNSLPLKQIIEGAILAAEAPLSIDQLMRLFEGDEPERIDVRDALGEIEQECEGRGFELKQVASGYRFQVKSDYGEWVSRLWKEKPPRYSRALLETLALIAYKQPITRGDVEEIRGVAVSTNIIRTLLEREWVRIVGHRDVPGHPALYATTKNFLDYFNLRNLDELPSLAEIKDLTQANEELDMEDDLIELPSLVVDVEEEEAVAGMDDTDLDAVSDQVDAIQQNIKNLFATDEQASAGEFAEDDGDSEASDIEQQSEPEVVEQIESVATEPTLQSGLESGSEIQSSPDDNRS